MNPLSRQLPPRAAKQTASPVIRQLPARSARQTTSYALKPGRASPNKSPGKHALILSDTLTAPNKAQTSAKLATSRNKIRQDIAENTKPKRDTFFLAKKDLFLPLLPNVNYITKLEKDRAVSGKPVDIIPSDTLLPQPRGITATMKPY